jgi:hypothetical protein
MSREISLRRGDGTNNLDARGHTAQMLIRSNLQPIPTSIHQPHDTEHPGQPLIRGNVSGATSRCDLSTLVVQLMTVEGVRHSALK